MPLGFSPKMSNSGESALKLSFRDVLGVNHCCYKTRESKWKRLQYIYNNVRNIPFQFSSSDI